MILLIYDTIGKYAYLDIGEIHIHIQYNPYGWVVGNYIHRICLEADSGVGRIGLGS